MQKINVDLTPIISAKQLFQKITGSEFHWLYIWIEAYASRIFAIF
jgi:hypothetical protein